MQTFLPYLSLYESANCLDDRRLNKQILEGAQILGILNPDYYEKLFGRPKVGNAWKNHPAVRMWRGYEKTLLIYVWFCAICWRNRGYSHKLYSKIQSLALVEGKLNYPPFLKDEKFRQSHQSNLLRKDYQFYSKYNWNVPTDLPYVWPV